MQQRQTTEESVCDLSTKISENLPTFYHRSRQREQSEPEVRGEKPMMRTRREINRRKE